MTVAIWTFIHLLVFVYWLGGDLGAFVLSRTVTSDNAEARDKLLASRILMVIDLAPRISLIAALPTGLTLASVMGWWPVADAILLAVWILSITWLGIALYLHHQPAADALRKTDLLIRVALIIGLIATAFSLTVPLFISIKLVLLAVAIALGLWIRHCLKDLGAGLAALASDDADTARVLLNSSIGKARLPVMGIWVTISLAAFMGLLRPV